MKTRKETINIHIHSTKDMFKKTNTYYSYEVKIESLSTYNCRIYAFETSFLQD